MWLVETEHTEPGVDYEVVTKHWGKHKVFFFKGSEAEEVDINGTEGMETRKMTKNAMSKGRPRKKALSKKAPSKKVPRKNAARKKAPSKVAPRKKNAGKKTLDRNILGKKT